MTRETLRPDIVRRLAALAPGLLLFLLVPLGSASACFGPKLYIGTGSGAESDLLFEIVALYVKEKTGTESVRVPLEGNDPLAALRDEKADLVFVSAAAAQPALLAVDGLPRLVAGRRPLQDLQFTTVGPALKKLGLLLSADDVAALAAQLEKGAAPAATARRYLTAKGWI